MMVRHGRSHSGGMYGSGARSRAGTRGKYPGRDCDTGMVWAREMRELGVSQRDGHTGAGVLVSRHP